MGKPRWPSLMSFRVASRASHHAVKVTAELRRRFDVAFAWNRELSPSIYLHSGPGSVGVTAMPLDVLPFTPATPPSLD